RHRSPISQPVRVATNAKACTCRLFLYVQPHGFATACKAFDFGPCVMLTLDSSPTAAWFRHRMLRALVQAQHVSSAQAQQAYDAQQQGGNWLESLVQQQAISADALARFLAQHQACSQVDLSDFPVQAQLLDVLPPHL